MAASIGHLVLIIGVQSALNEQLAQEEKKIKKFAGQAKRDVAGIAGGAGGDGAAKGSIAGGVLGFMAGGPMGQLLGGASPVGMAIGIGIQKIREQFMAGARDADLMAASIREIEKSITSVADRSQAMKAGLIPDDAERIKAADNEIKKIESTYGDFKGARAEVAGGFAFIANEWMDGFKRDILGIKTISAEGMAAQREEQEKLKARFAATKALRDSMDDEMAAIGKTAREAEILKLAKQGLSKVDRESLLAQAKKIDAMKQEADAQQKLKDGIKSYQDELVKSIETIGMSADEIKLKELAGGDKWMIDRLRNMAKLREEMQAGMALVEKNPVDEIFKQMAGLAELQQRGIITAQQAADAQQKAKNGFIDNKLAGQKLPEFLEKGSVAEVKYRRELEARQKQEKLLEQQLKGQEMLRQLQADTNRIMRNVADAVEQQFVINVLGV